MAQQNHPIFHAIDTGDLLAAQLLVLAIGAVLEEHKGSSRGTPLIHAIFSDKPAIALWRTAGPARCGDCN